MRDNNVEEFVRRANWPLVLVVVPSLVDNLTSIALLPLFAALAY